MKTGTSVSNGWKWAAASSATRKLLARREELRLAFETVEVRVYEFAQWSAGPRFACDE